MIFLYFFSVIEPSYNQPKFSSCATWNSSAITFTNDNTSSIFPWGLFVDISNTIYIADKINHTLQIWLERNMTLWKTISVGSYDPYTIFVTFNGDIYTDNGKFNNQVDMWTLNSTSSVTVMEVSEACHGLFVDLYNNIYCSINNDHMVVKRLFNLDTNISTIVAGNGSNGSSSTLLSSPRGIFVDIKLNLYVADCGNNRIQLFQFDQLNATTVVGNETITLNCPDGIILDGDGNLFITDYNNHRIIGSGPNGFRCIGGCTDVNGSAANQLYYPRALSFDSYGNIFVADRYTNRIQKFLLATNFCGKWSYI